MPDGGGERKNTGKTRYSLEPTIARTLAAKNLMVGAAKYDDWNWARGMSWTWVLDCLERHTMKIKAGQDIDPEDGIPHAAKIISNAQFLLEYLHTYQRGDDRRHRWLDLPKIGLDIDEVVADFVGAWIARYGGERPAHWNFGYQVRSILREIADDREFWLSLAPIGNPRELPFDPHCYITARSCSVEVTQEWIQRVGLPTRPVINVGLGGTKVDAATDQGLDLFVDDNFETFVAMWKAGIPCYLFDRTHNKKYNVGAKRIHTLSDILHINHVDDEPLRQ